MDKERLLGLIILLMKVGLQTIIEMDMAKRLQLMDQVTKVGGKTIKEMGKE